ncbi:excitatory amino acid transporter 1-like isoform X2 [Dermacentor albipictus]|uniref:excitatory amino acid transporter 1-like isoform X2 n=1 Tax=Dermacentor albipictus TaxID=60249 RepID=UPI0031FCB1AC
MNIDSTKGTTATKDSVPTACQDQVGSVPKRLERGSLRAASKFPRLQSVYGPTSGRQRRTDAGSTTSKESIGADRTRKGSVRSRDGLSSQQDLEPRADVLEVVMSNPVIFFVLLAVVLGFALGAALNPLNLSELQRRMLRLPGELFVRVQQCLAIPLFITSVVSAVGGQPTAEGARLALRTLAYFSLTTLWSATSGMVIALLLRPGVGARKLPPHWRYNVTMSADSLLDIFRNIIPENFVEAFVFMTQTTVATNHNASDTVHVGDDHPAAAGNLDVGDEGHPEKLAHTNFVGLLGFSLLLGFALSHSQPPSPSFAMNDFGGVETPPAGSSHFVLRLARVLGSKFLRMAEKTLCFSPVAVSTLIAADASRVSDLSKVVRHLALYSFTVLLGLGVHAFLFLPALYMTKVRRDAGRFFLNLLHPLAIAFGSRSSMVGGPAAMAILEKKVGLHQDSVRLIVPLSVVINHDGTALYTMVSVLFAAQLQGESLGVSSLVMLLASCCIATMGEYGLMPTYRGPARAALLLTVVGLSADNVGYMAVVHWLLERAASTVNLLSDCVGAAILQRDMLQPGRPGSTRSFSVRLGPGSIGSLSARDLPSAGLLGTRTGSPTGLPLPKPHTKLDH